MSAGTLTLTNNSAAVGGSGTAFTTELAAGDFILVTVGGITYTLAVKSVDSATKLTLVSKYPGPTQTGLAWNSVPRATQNQVTAELVAQSTEALRGLNYDKQNWQQIFSNSGNITVRLPDGSTFSGPSWNKISSIIATVDIDLLQTLATQIYQDAAQVAADKAAAALSASTASTDAGIATTKAGEASASANTATSQAGEASDSAELAHKWAANPEDVVVSGGEFSSYHWSQKAEKSAAEAASHNPNESLVKSLNLSDLTDRAAAWMNVRPVGATPLAADPVSAYDATTRRWVENLIGSGTIGPTMNGVMNYGVGSRELWQSRSYIPPYALPLDGQIVNRADWPELWAHAQMHGAIADSVWIADPTKRAMYSTGDGSTTFRLPDTNGVQKNGVNGFTGPNSIEALFGRGDNGDNAGIVSPSGLPNITGTIAIRSGRTSGGDLASSGITSSGAMSVNTSSAATNAPNALHSTATTNATTLSIDASTQNPIYGRTLNELRPNSFFGVWIVRASGGFVAANTSWSVINADSALPGAGVVVKGGAVNSEYRANAKTKHAIKIESVLTVGDSDSHGAMITHTLNTDGGALESERTAYLITDYEDSFLPWNDPRVLEWITWPSGISSTEYELMVKISRKYIVIKGVLRRTITLSTLSIATFKKMPPGASRVVAPSTSAVFSVAPPNSGLMMTNALNATSNGVLSVENAAAGSAWVCLDVTAAFM